MDWKHSASTPSEKENRMLQGFPRLSAGTLFSGEFSKQFDDFLSDNFTGRDAMVDAAEGTLKLFDAVKGDEAFEKKARQMEQDLAREGAAGEESEGSQEGEGPGL